MKVKAKGFGGAEIYHLRCDACRKPVPVAWRGRAGVYCSEACLGRVDNKRWKALENQAASAEVDGPPKVKVANETKVKTGGTNKVKTMSPAAREATKVKITPPKVKIEAKPVTGAPKVKSGRTRRRIDRRSAIWRIRREILEETGQEPTIAVLRNRLKPLGLKASVRTVWKDLSYCRTSAREVDSPALKIPQSPSR